MRLKLRRISTSAKEAHTINKYKNVRNSHDIAVSLADYLENSAPKQYPPGNRAGTVCRLNDILQGRAQQTADDLLAEIEACGDDAKKTEAFKSDIRDFLRQKAILPHPFPYQRADWPTPPETLDTIGYDPPKKVIDQMLYDEAARRGFPPSFFRESFFDHVTLYCVPDFMSCARSVFQECEFSVCRLWGINFSQASIYSTDFGTVEMHDVVFSGATLAHTRFFDCNMSQIAFADARLVSCRMTDCKPEKATFSGATIDDCAFDRMQAEAITGLYHATITQGGATAEECQHNREAVYRALRLGKPIPRSRPRAAERRR